MRSPPNWQKMHGGWSKRLPKGSIMVGRVLEAHPRSGGNSQAKLSLSFYKARLKDGT